MNHRRHPLTWIPTLYFAEGVPYVIVMTLAVVMYKRLGLSNTDITLYTSWLYLPWVIKPLWSPVVDILRTKRWWILFMQILIGASLAGVAFTLPTSYGIQCSLAFLWLLAFSSATHDVAADGFYMLELEDHEQAMYVGWRNTFYRIATIAGQGLLTMVAGVLEVYTRQPVKAWSITFLIAMGLFVLLYLYHQFILPRPQADRASGGDGEQFSMSEFLHTFQTFFRKRGIGVALLFLLTYRLPEALLVKICPLFLVDTVQNGGLGLSPQEFGFAQGTVGVVGLLLGGILGGTLIAHYGLKRCLWWMVSAISLPNIVYLYLGYFQPEGLAAPSICIFIEQFGYGCGFAAYTMYMLYFAQGESRTAHFAFCTGFMALGMMLPGFAAGALQELMGYYNFFILIICLVPITYLAAGLLRLPEEYGMK